MSVNNFNGLWLDKARLLRENMEGQRGTLNAVELKNYNSLKIAFGSIHSPIASLSYKEAMESLDYMIDKVANGGKTISNRPH